MCSLIRTELRHLCTFFKHKIHHELIPICLIQIQDKQILCNLIYLKSLFPFARTVYSNSHWPRCNFSALSHTTHTPASEWGHCHKSHDYGTHFKIFLLPFCLSLWHILQGCSKYCFRITWEVPLCHSASNWIHKCNYFIYLQLLGMALLFNFVLKSCITTTVPPTAYTGSLFHFTSNF